MSTGVGQYAEHEYDNRSVQHYWFIDFTDFSLILPLRGEDMSLGYVSTLNTNMITFLYSTIDLSILLIFR